MTLDAGAVGRATDPVDLTWTSKDCMLYALGVGSGTDEPEFTTENTAGVRQLALPTMAAVLGPNMRVLKLAGDFDWAKLVHAEQEISLHRPIETDMQAQASTKIKAMYDKGDAAIVVAETEVTGAADDRLFSSTSTLIIRGAGGWGGDRGPSLRAPVPDRPPDRTVEDRTLPVQALLYRLSGDRNPLDRKSVV